MAAPVQRPGESAVIPIERPPIGTSLRDHIENVQAPHVMGQAHIGFDGIEVVNSAATYFAYRYDPNHTDPDFPHPDQNNKFGRVLEVLGSILGMTREQLLNNENLGQDLIDNAEAVEAEFYRRFGDPGEETELDGDGVTESKGPGRKMRGCGHRMYGKKF